MNQSGVGGGPPQGGGGGGGPPPMNVPPGSVSEPPRIWKREQDDDSQQMGGGGDASNGGGNYSGGGFGQSDPNSYGGTPGSVFSQGERSSPICDFQNGPRSGQKTPKYAPSPSPSEPTMSNVGGGIGGGGGFHPQSNSNGFGFGSPHHHSMGPGPFGSPSTPPCPPFNRPYSAGPVFSGASGNGPPPGRGPPQFGPANGPAAFAAGQYGGGQYGGDGGFPPSIMAPRNAAAASHGQQMERMDAVGGLRKHNSSVSHTEHRIFELNMRIQQRTDETDNCWWDSFATEFFEDDALLTILFCLEDGPKRYTIGRTLIPRFFRSIFDGGVSDLYFQLQNAKESFHNTLITLDCDHCTIMTQHGEPFYTKVCAEARLILEFVYDDYMRIKSWHMTIKGHREMIPRSVIASSMSADPVVLEQISKNITRSGITNATLNYLRLCDILEPMQELMSRHKAFELSPRDCLKTTLFQKWQRMVAPTAKKDPQKPATKKRKRKTPAAGGGGGRGGGAGSKTPPAAGGGGMKRSPSRNNSYPLAFQDVMVVGEPTLMGGEVGEEDERLITRLNNNQYDVVGVGGQPMSHENHSGFGHESGSPMSGPQSWKQEAQQRGPPPGMLNSPGHPGMGGMDMGKKSPNML